MTQEMREKFVRLNEQSRTKNPQARYALIAFLQSSIDCGDVATFEDVGFCFWNISDQYALLRDGHSQAKIIGDFMNTFPEATPPISTGW